MSIGSEFSGLPIEELVSAPLLAAANSQAKLAALTADFIQKVGVKSDGSVNTVNFAYTTSTNGQQSTNTIAVPLLSIVNVPGLAVKRAEVEFTMEVKTQAIDKDAKDATLSVSAGCSWAPFSCKIHGSVTTKSEHTRSTDKSAKYDVKVEARDDGMPEGLARVLDMLAANIANPAHSDAAAAAPASGP